MNDTESEGEPPAATAAPPSRLGYIALLAGTALVSGAAGWAIGRGNAPAVPAPVAAAVAPARSESPTPESSPAVADVTPPSPAPSAFAAPSTAPSASPAAQAALLRANGEFDRKEWRTAIADYRKAIALGLDNPDVRTDLGTAYRFAGEPTEAVKQYQTARKQNPDHENSLSNLASIYTDVLNQPARAIPLCEEYLRRFPQGHSVSEVSGFLLEARKMQQKRGAAGGSNGAASASPPPG